MPTRECVLWIIYLPCEEICLFAQFDTKAASHESAEDVKFTLFTLNAWMYEHDFSQPEH